MNREHWKELLPIITAFANGEDVEMNHHGSHGWQKLDSPDFGAEARDYRIALKPRKVWVNEYPEGYLPNPVDAYPSKEMADQMAGSRRIACHELELPPLP